MNKKNTAVNLIYYIGEYAAEYPNNLECITTKDFKTWLKEHNKSRLEEGQNQEFEQDFLVKSYDGIVFHE